MSEDSEFDSEETPDWRALFEGQLFHVVLLALLLVAAWLFSGNDAFMSGEFWGLSTTTWFWIALGSAVLHQLEVTGWWRMALHTTWLEEIFKSRERAFKIYVVEFALLILSRPFTIAVLAIANRDVEALLPYREVFRAVALAGLIPVAWLGWSIVRSFGFKRATGIDHFYPDPAREAGLVRKGIFRYLPNAMYTAGFLLLWAPALWFGSPAALGAALFHHVYIWVHYVCTERPDMRQIYG